MTPTRSIQIVGGGLAGLSLGLALRRENIDTTIIEAGTYPRHRVCGEFITGLPVRTIERLGLAPLLADARLNQNVAWFDRGRPARQQYLPAPALSLSRYHLDARLAEAFVAAGGHLRTGTRNAATVDVPGCVFATGRRRSESRWLGLKVHALELPVASDLEFHLGVHAYVGLARIEENRVNICGLFQRREISAKGADLLTRYLRAAGLPELATRIEGAALDSESFCAVAALSFDRQVHRGADVRLGDACAMIPPFTGHGMAMAFQSAELALDPLLDFAHGRAEWPETRTRIQNALHRRFRVRLASACGLHSYLLVPARQRWLALLNRLRLLPLRPIYSALH